MQKQKQYDIAGSNIANLGTELERQVKAAAADGEPAWDNAGKAAGIEVWRIEKFKVVPWPKEQYGSFYDGDSYIVLHTIAAGPKLMWNVHFWLGTFTTQDEAGTAAYKTVELDDKLAGAPVQFREVQGHESNAFLDLFGGEIRLLSGGVDSGFVNVAAAKEAEKTNIRLLHIKGKRKIRVAQVPVEFASLNSGDVFLLDCDTKLYQWNGSKAGIFEKNKGAELCRTLDQERSTAQVVLVIDEANPGADGEEMYKLLAGSPSDIKSAEEGGDDAEVAAITGEKRLFKLSDASGSMEFTEVTPIRRDALDSDDVFILDAGDLVYAWIGTGASPDERKTALGAAQDYLAKYNRPAYTPITRIFDGGDNPNFEAAFN